MMKLELQASSRATAILMVGIQGAINKYDTRKWVGAYLVGLQLASREFPISEEKVQGHGGWIGLL